MAMTKEFRAYVEDRLAAVVEIRSRAMFGGLGVFHNDMIFAVADDGVVYLKVDDSNRADFEAVGKEAFVPFDGAKPMGYYEIPDGLLENPEELKVWVDKAIHVAETAALKKPKKR